MEKSINTNDFLASLPKIRRRRIWNVIIDGKVVQGVSSDSNKKSTAEAYIAQKYPGKQFKLVFACWKV
ncbi:hypothetical protein EBU95_21495 [bacterium]|nr:hypothetical protein [bacterium]